MKTRLYNARILPMKTVGENPFFGEIHIEEGKITYAGESVKTAGQTFDEEIDCETNLLMPGFKNAHTHSAMTFLRSYADDLPLREWLFDKVFPMEAKLTYDDIYDFAKLAILEYLTSGITANFDMYMNSMAHAEASVAMGFRTVFCGAINDFGGTVEENEEEYLRLNQMNPLISAKIGFHAEYTNKKETLERMAALGAKHKAPVYTHLSETKREVDECIGRYGMSPVKLLNSLGMFEFGGGGFHGVYLDQEDREICKEKNISIVSNPSSNLKLASGIADLHAMEENGINVALGTDGAASNNALDFFREMYLASVLQKMTKMDAAATDANEVLRMATVGGARAMGLYDCDTLEKGKRADIICINLKRPNMQPINSLTKNLVYSGSKENVKMTMVEGKILYRDGKFLINDSAEEIYQRVNKRMERLCM